MSTITCGDQTVPVALVTATHTLLTDSPFPYSRVARVDLYIVSVSASLSADTSSAGSFVTLATPNRKINLLALQGGATDELGVTQLPAGAIKAVRMVIDTDSSSMTLSDGTVLTGKSSPGIAWQSSAGRPTLNADINEQIAVPDSGATIVIDYDVGRAFIQPQEVNPSSTDQGFIFSPVFSAYDRGRTGSIAGSVRAKTSGGAPVSNASLRLYVGNPSNPENTWGVIATARTAVDGTFKFGFVPTTGPLVTRAGNAFIVAVDPPGGSTLGRQIVSNISVTARSETGIGVVVLP
jgi:hypothetical protein